MNRRSLALGVTGALALLLSLGAVVSWTQDDSPAAAGSIERGEALFHAKGCAGCHQFSGAGGRSMGPDLTHLRDRAGEQVEGLSAEEYVRVSILNPDSYRVPGYPAVMPRLPVTGDEVDELVRFLLSER